MKKIIAGFALYFCCAYMAQAQVGKHFPEIKGETLDGKSMRLPAAAKGKYTLLGLAFSQKSEEALQTWFQPVYTLFIEKGQGGLFDDFAYDVNVYFVPMFTGANKLAAGPARQKAVKTVDAELHKHVLFYIGELEPYQQQLGMKDKDQPYFFVLDEGGKVVYATSGHYSDAKMEQVEEILGEVGWE